MEHNIQTKIRGEQYKLPQVILNSKLDKLIKEVTERLMKVIDVKEPK